jgi:hypothetical protein
VLKNIDRRAGRRNTSSTILALAGKDVAGGEELRVEVSGHDLEQQFRHEEQPAPDHVSRGLAVGHLIREVASK